MGSTTVLRGFKVAVVTLDAFLAANNEHETYGTPPFFQDHPDKDPISVLLYKKITKAGGTDDKNKFRLVIPSREGHGESTIAYVTYAWVAVYAHVELRLDQDLPMEVPTGFEELRREIISFSNGIADVDGIADDGHMGLFAVTTNEIRGLYRPQAFRDQFKAPQRCDRCDAVFDDPTNAFDQKQDHRKTVHGSVVGRGPIPDG